MKNTFKNLSIIASLLFANIAIAGTEGMSSMPKIEPKRTFTVQGNEDFDSQKGFGEQAPAVRMMNLMMVEGSGMEGMEMDMTVAQNEHSGHHVSETTTEKKSVELPYDFQMKSSPAQAAVGTNTVEITVTNQKDKKPAKNLHLKSQVYMTSMDMGTEEPKVKEIAPGKYQVKAAFSMKGPWAIKLIFPDGSEKVFDFDVSQKK